MLSENDAYRKNLAVAVADDTVVDADEVGRPSAIDQETEPVCATGAGEGAEAEVDHASTQSPLSLKTSKWMMT
jgi:hypothetical protein